MKEKTNALKAAFPRTIPVLTGFSFLGIAYGILMYKSGYGFCWTLLMSVFGFAGSAQYLAINFLTSAFDPLNALLLILMVNARHLFYGLSMLERFRNVGRLKPYLIFGMCDETFSILCATEPPEGVNRKWFMFFITLLDHCYWVAGSVIGSFLGYMVSFDTKGLDFVLTALFVVIFMEQWKSTNKHGAAIIGILCSVVCLLLFGKANFIIPSMIAILTTLTLMKKKLSEV